MSTNDDPKESYYNIIPLEYIDGKPRICVDGHFRVFKAKYPKYPDGMEYKVEFPTNIENANFYKDLEEIVSTVEPENENFSSKPFLSA